MLTGGNGAGKSTFYRTRLEKLGLPFVNADLIARELYPKAPEAHSYDAAKVAERIRRNLLYEGRSFCFETVFSHPSKIDFIAEAKALGYEVILVFIHLDSIALNKARISQRVAEGGHDVPDEKVEQRVPRLLNHVRSALPLCDQVRLLDNTLATNPFRVVATVRQGLIQINRPPPPAWAAALLTPFEIHFDTV
ncbi:dephospho-CoA kinase [Exilibacterium tricleocarpae]|uniref:Dephospho-CoA kinase n=2 Tax=Exilibacterium tricleocarpae TaxID=2591008 RepID=A0A545T8P3_9GAMM|nr:dephospho-CoA kinase [Exilibacterium tricleocarpae]